MPAPRIEIELDKLAHNARKLTALYSSKGICVTAVTKGVCGSPRIAGALLNSGIRSFGDSRIANIQKMREAGLDAQFILIPGLSHKKSTHYGRALRTYQQSDQRFTQQVQHCTG